LLEKDPGLVIFEAEDGAQALERLAEIREKFNRDPLFIVCDLEMPVMDGWQLIEKLRGQYESEGKTQGIPIIVLSASSGEKGHLFLKKTVHGSSAKYNPMVTVAKQECLKPGKYDASGDKGLMAWVKYFMRSNTSAD
jgi:CheY-like chemotaxis protein